MAPEALTADRLHRDIKALILRGYFGAGRPLTVHAMAEAFGTSISPVRDALNRLVGERLVEMQGGGGFAIPAITTRNTYDLYALHAELIRAALKDAQSFAAVGQPSAQVVARVPDHHSVADATASFFIRLAGCSANMELQDAIMGLGERLAVRRLCEGAAKRHAEELIALWNLTEKGNKSAIRGAMWQYHRRRLLRAQEIADAASKWISSEFDPEIL